MIRLIYASSAVEPFSGVALRTLLVRARERNTKQDISGALLHVDGSFLQFLEGPAAVLESTFARISRDPRHARVLVLSRAEIDERAFPDWSMGFLDATGHASSLEGYRASNGFADLHGDTASLMRIVQGFRDGRWRVTTA